MDGVAVCRGTHVVEEMRGACVDVRCELLEQRVRFATADKSHRRGVFFVACTLSLLAS